MRIITRTRLVDFGTLHPPAVGPMRAWEVAVKAAGWTCSNDVKQTFRNADWAFSRWIFDVSRYRIVSGIRYQVTTANGNVRLGVVYIKEVFTHTEYDQWTAAMTKKGKSK